jgi:2-aminoethylphosphonate-pyruvate transaminase
MVAASARLDNTKAANRNGAFRMPIADRHSHALPAFKDGPVLDFGGSDPVLLTPGPLTTSASVKSAMMRDLGSRDAAFVEINRRVLDRIAAIVDGGDRFAAVPLQGSGTFVVEAMIATFLPPDGKLLVLINGAYGARMAEICRRMGRNFCSLEWPEHCPVDADRVTGRLQADPSISHVVVVQCETTTGMLNPIERIADAVADQGRRLLIDAMSSFGAIALDARRVVFDAAAASANKCLEGVPGVGFCVARLKALAETEGHAGSLCLDLYDQWRAMVRNGQWRFTPPTHVILALDQALAEFEQEGGVTGRGRRYRANHRTLVEAMRALGFETLLPDDLQAPIIVTFRLPADPQFVFEDFYEQLHRRGYVIYPGKLTTAESFRIGCIGQVRPSEISAAVQAIAATMADMGVASGAPA